MADTPDLTLDDDDPTVVDVSSMTDAELEDHYGPGGEVDPDRWKALHRRGC